MVCKYFALWDELDPIYVTGYDIYMCMCGYIYMYAGNGIMSNTVLCVIRVLYVLKALIYDVCTYVMNMICFMEHVCIMCYLKLYDGIVWTWGTNG